jgi:hypothetical protein
MNYKRSGLLFLFPALLCSLTYTMNPIQNYRASLFSQNITAPIYNIPLQRALTPPEKWPGLWLTLMPFIQASSCKFFESIDVFKLNNIEGGLLVGLGYYGKYWYIREALDFIESNTTINYVSANLKIDKESKFGLLDDLVALGLKTNNERNWQLSGEGFYGISNERIRQFEEVGNEHGVLINAPSMGTGAQINFAYTRDESAGTMGEVLTLSRFTYFIPVKAADIYVRSIFKQQDVGSIHYSPGAFFDLFFAYKHYWGTDLRHQYEIGYNPTIHVMKESVKTVKDYDKAIITSFTETIPTVLNTVYVAYRYTRDGKMPINFSVGATLSFAEHIRSSGTFFATFAIRI